MTTVAVDTLSRRTLLKVGAATAGGLLLGFELWPARAAMRTAMGTGEFVRNAFIRIDRTGTITLVMPQVELGQGVYTCLATVLAEELDASLDPVFLEAAPPNEKLYANPQFGLQATGNSNSIRAFWTPLRKAAAGTRAMLVQAAAQAWSVDANALRATDGTVIHDASGRKLGYGELASRAANQQPPADPTLKTKDQFKLIGKPLKRLDTPDKVNGRAIYGIDVMPEGVKVATPAACPVFGGTVGKVDDQAAKAIPGVRQVVVLEDLVAVVGDHYWAAKQGLEALKVAWKEGPNAA